MPNAAPTVAALLALLDDAPVPETVKLVERNRDGDIVKVVERPPRMSWKHAGEFVAAVDALLPDLVDTTPDAEQWRVIERALAIRNDLAAGASS